VTRDVVKLTLRVYANWLNSPNQRLRDIAEHEILTAVDEYTAHQCARIVIPRAGRPAGEPSATITPTAPLAQEDR